MSTQAMLQTYPQPMNLDTAMLTKASDAALECAQVCTCRCAHSVPTLAWPET